MTERPLTHTSVVIGPLDSHPHVPHLQRREKCLDTRVAQAFNVSDKPLSPCLPPRIRDPMESILKTRFMGKGWG